MDAQKSSFYGNGGGLSTLEVGAGSLNQLKFEKGLSSRYDVVEPYSLLLQTSPGRLEIDDVYPDISDIPEYVKYDRITSIACFEHILNLPEVVESIIHHMKPGGILSVAIPNEGRFLWHFAYTMTTGREFQKKYGLSYEIWMRYHHVNTADEIETILSYYFSDIKMSLFGINKDLAFYRYYECRLNSA